MIYVDANATYPVDPQHYDDVARILKTVDGNPSSIHQRGREAKVALEDARSHLARMIGARPSEVIFTSGATEANNMVIQGLVTRERLMGQGTEVVPHIVVSAVEHKAVLDPVMVLAERQLCRVDLAPVTKSGDLDREHLLSLIQPETALVCLMHANNEVGMVYPLAELAPRIKERAPQSHLHVDAVQMLGKGDLTWYAQSPIDSAAFSGHKIGAYKGVGALYLKAGRKLALFLAGGGQERGRRAGTENMPGIVSFGLQCKAWHGQEEARSQSMQALRQILLAALREIPEVVIHGDTPEMLPNTVHFHLEGVRGDDLLLNMDLAGIHASSGSACSAGSSVPSHVVLAMGYSEWTALNSVRISLSATNRTEDIPAILKVIRDVRDRTLLRR